MRFVLLIKQLNILQAIKRFSVDLQGDFTDNIIQGDLQGIGDLTGYLDGRFFLYNQA